MNASAATITNVVTPPPKKTNTTSNINTSLQQSVRNRESNGDSPVDALDEEQTKSPTLSNNKNHATDVTMIDNPYNKEDKREHILNQTINIKFERNRYTTPIAIEFRQKKDLNTITLAKLHRDIFTEILIIDSTAKMITNYGKTYAHPKELPLGKDYANEFTTSTVNNSKFNSVKAYVYCNIEISISYKKFLYNDDRDKTILPLLRKYNMWLRTNSQHIERRQLRSSSM